MPVAGPDYNKDRADKIGVELYDYIVEHYKVLNYPTTPAFKDELRNALKEDCNKLAHKFLRYDSFESF